MGIMEIEERKERLSSLARTDIYSRQLHATDVINAIDTLNKMDSLYKQSLEVTPEVVYTFIFRLPNGITFTPGLPVIEGEAQELPALAESGQEDTKTPR